MTPSYQLTLKATKETSCRLWNNVLITSEEKRKAMIYLAANFENLAKIYALNKRMGDLVLTRTRNGGASYTDEQLEQLRKSY